jgi:signal transduction histidine kinase
LGLLVRDISFLIIGYIVTTLMKTQRQQRQQLEESNRKLAAYATTREQLFISQERNRLARELHDTVAHTMSAVTVKLNAVQILWETDSERAEKMLEEVITSMNDGMAETRRALRDLRASPLEDMGMVLAIRHLAENAAQRGGFSLDLQTPHQDLRLSANIEQAVYRISQEALANSVEHANASTVSVFMECEAGCLKLSIADNGCGFDVNTASQNGHFGLLGMRERADMISGHLHISSIQGYGTTVELLLETTT